MKYAVIATLAGAVLTGVKSVHLACGSRHDYSRQRPWPAA